MGITITTASAEQVTGTMPVDGNTQPYGLLHGGASCVLAETLGSLGAALTAARAGLRSASRSARRTTARRRSARSPGSPPGCTAGRTMISYEIVISDDQDRRVCTARLTCLLRDQVPRRRPAVPAAADRARAARGHWR